MAEPQITVKEKSAQEEHVVLENKSDKYSSFSEIILDSDVPLQPMNEKPQTTTLKRTMLTQKMKVLDLEGFEKILNTNLLHLVIDQPQLALLKGKLVFHWKIQTMNLVMVK